jgi:hypothetical protein
MCLFRKKQFLMIRCISLKRLGRIEGIEMGRGRRNRGASR